VLHGKRNEYTRAYSRVSAGCGCSSVCAHGFPRLERMCGGTRACCFLSVCVLDDAEGNLSANEALESRDCERGDATEGAREDDAETALLTRIALLEMNESLAEMPLTL